MAWHSLGASEGGGGATSPPSNASLPMGASFPFGRESLGQERPRLDGPTRATRMGRWSGNGFVGRVPEGAELPVPDTKRPLAGAGLDDPKQRVHISRWHHKREDAHVGNFPMFVGYFLTIFS